MLRKAIHATTLITLWVMPWLILGAVVWAIGYGLTR